MKTAWFDEENLPFAMVSSNFKNLEDSEHFYSLSECFNKAKEASSIIDLGCGAGEVGRVFSTNYKYTGADLPHIIEKVSKLKNPNNNYLYFNAEDSDMNFIHEFDIVLMNSFLSEIPNWYLVLSKILTNSKKYIIIHRQSITKEASKNEEYSTYANLKTINTIINYKSFIKLFEMNNFEKIFETQSFVDNKDKHTFLFKKND